MGMMQLARIHQPNEIRLDPVERPTPGPDDVLIEVHRCGICGSDLTYSKIGGIPGAASPFAIGHEFAGVVAEAGARVQHVQVGDRVVINPEGAANGIGSDGHKGAFAPWILFERATDDPDAVIKLPETVDFELAALIEPLSVGRNGVERGQLRAGEKVTVFGAGPVGLSAAIAARHLGAASVVVTDLSEKRLATARDLGFTTFEATDDPRALAEFLHDEHGTVRLDRRLGPQPATDLLIEATGVGAVFEQMLGLARAQARIVVLGVHFAPVELNMINLLMRQLTIVASQAYTNEVFGRVIEMLASGETSARGMITHHFPLSRFTDAFAQASRPDEAVKVVVDCQS